MQTMQFVPTQASSIQALFGRCCGFGQIVTLQT